MGLALALRCICIVYAQCIAFALHYASRGSALALALRLRSMGIEYASALALAMRCKRNALPSQCTAQVIDLSSTLIGLVLDSYQTNNIHLEWYEFIFNGEQLLDYSHC